jgi:hypothetical protein
MPSKDPQTEMLAAVGEKHFGQVMVTVYLGRD